MPPSILRAVGLFSAWSEDVVTLLPKAVFTVLEKLASSPRAAASSFKVSKASGAESTKPDT